MVFDNKQCTRHPYPEAYQPEKTGFPDFTVWDFVYACSVRPLHKTAHKTTISSFITYLNYQEKLTGFITNIRTNIFNNQKDEFAQHNFAVAGTNKLRPQLKAGKRIFEKEKIS